MLKSLECIIEEADTARVAVRLMARNTINVILAVVDRGDPGALELLAYVNRKHAEVPVIVMLTEIPPERANEALGLGAMAVLKYPICAAEIRTSVLQALDKSKAQPVGTPPPPQPAGLAGTGISSQQVIGAQTLLRPSTVDFSPSDVPEMAPAIQRLLPERPFMNVLPPSTSPVARPAVDTSLARTIWFSREIDLVTADPCFRQIVNLASNLALTSLSVLIVGEPGTGKSLLAQLLHLGRNQGKGPFVTLNCTALSEPNPIGEESQTISADASTLLTDWQAKLAQARGGTLLVQEVGLLPPELQLQLVRELKVRNSDAANGVSQTQRHPNIRFVLSTSENLPALVEQGSFRSELYHRISTICLTLPPLRRRADIGLLAEHFRISFTEQLRKNVVGFTCAAVDALHAHDWPGNVRELKTVIRNALALCNGPRITSCHLASILHDHRVRRRIGAITQIPSVPKLIPSLKEALEEPEKRIICQTLQAFNWNRAATARFLEIERTTLYKKMKKYNIISSSLSTIQILAGIFLCETLLRVFGTCASSPPPTGF
jgi:DNA-binding NtrC family response regulator